VFPGRHVCDMALGLHILSVASSIQVLLRFFRVICEKFLGRRGT
jgi:hypothetical protein